LIKLQPKTLYSALEKAQNIERLRNMKVPKRSLEDADDDDDESRNEFENFVYNSDDEDDEFESNRSIVIKLFKWFFR
jgi:hypothetical protein